MKTYNKFVDYYDEIIRGSGYDINSEVEFLDEMIVKFSPLLTREGQGVGDILESACGTGSIARELEKKGYNVFGVDLSEEMIKKANNKQKFIIGDMTSINLKLEYDIILCNYNSVCHLNSWEDWQKFFKNSYKHLKKGGIFIFDILTVFEFENMTKDFRGFFNVKGDTICLEMFSHPQPLPCKEGSKYYKWLIKMFINSGENKYNLVEEEIKEISFPVDEIKKKN
ncbi:MAG: class I SAM-dependent methyltransferase [Candidatus Gracilibacteria bacterium]|nr:class I SAM-dependent methyltransferase [Candidatus Gracilibacteria bacterium]